MPPSPSYVAEAASAASSQSASHSDSSVAPAASQLDAALPPASANTCPECKQQCPSPKELFIHCMREHGARHENQVLCLGCKAWIGQQQMGNHLRAASDPCGEAMRAAGLDSAPARKQVVPKRASRIVVPVEPPPVLHPHAPEQIPPSLNAEASTIPGLPPLLPELQQLKRTWRRILLELAARLQRAALPYLRSYQNHSLAGNLEMAAQALHQFLLIPAQFLERRRGGKKKGRAKKQLGKTLDRAGENAERWELGQEQEAEEPQVELEESGEEGGAVSPQLLSNDDTTRRVRRCVELAKENHLSRATSALLQNPLAEPSTATFEKLRSLHPPASPAFVAPAVPPGAKRYVQLDEKKFNSILQKLRNGAAPGPSCWTGELLHTICLDQHCREGVIAIITDLLNGSVHSSVRPLLLASRLIPILKEANTAAQREAPVEQAVRVGVGVGVGAGSGVEPSSPSSSSSGREAIHPAPSPALVSESSSSSSFSSSSSSSAFSSSSFLSSSSQPSLASSSSSSGVAAAASASAAAQADASSRIQGEAGGGGRPKPPGVRPVAVGEVLYKMAAMYSLEEIGEESLRSLFPNIQVGVAVKGGAERALHLVQAWLESGDEDHIFIKLDLSNAFNSCSRQQMLSSFFSHPVLSPAWNLFSWAYSEPSPLLYYNLDKLEHILSSSEGGRQGDPLMPLAFALLVQPLYASAAIEGVNLAADLDDLGIEGPREKAFTSFEKVIASAPQYHLPPNLQKTRVFSLHPTPELEEACRVRGLQLEKGEVMEWLGGLVGKLDSEQARRWCIEQVEALRVPLFQRALLHPQMPRTSPSASPALVSSQNLTFSLESFLHQQQHLLSPSSTAGSATSSRKSFMPLLSTKEPNSSFLSLCHVLEASVSYPVNALPMLRTSPPSSSLCQLYLLCFSLIQMPHSSTASIAAWPFSSAMVSLTENICLRLWRTVLMRSLIQVHILLNSSTGSLRSFTQPLSTPSSATTRRKTPATSSSAMLDTKVQEVLMLLIGS